MKKLRIKSKIYPILWSIILLVSLYLLVRFALLSFSDDMGQASPGFKEAVISALCSNVMESGSAFLSYSMKQEETFDFPISLVSDDFVLQQFARNNSVTTAKAQEFSSLSTLNNNDFNKINEAEESDRSNKIGFNNVTKGILSREYVLTNGALFSENFMNNALYGDAKSNGELDVGYVEGNIEYIEDDTTTEALGPLVETNDNSNNAIYTLEQLKDLSFLVRNFYTVHPDTKATEQLFDAEKLLAKDMTIKQNNEKPQILIYHTHSREAYADSRPNKKSDTVLGMGSYLKQILEERYGYNVIHDTTTYDGEGKIYGQSYTRAELGLTKILEENPTIEVVIDLHRDAGDNRTVLVEGEETAKVMLFNGLCRDLEGPRTDLDNPNLQDNLAFSLQLQLKSLEIYPGLFNKIYLRGYRFNMHVRPKCLLVELGTEKNTVQAAKNALKPFAVVLNSVLQGDITDSTSEEATDDDLNTTVERPAEPKSSTEE